MGILIRVMDYTSKILVNFALAFIIIITFMNWLVSLAAVFWLFMRLRDLIEQEELWQRIERQNKKKPKRARK